MRPSRGQRWLLAAAGDLSGCCGARAKACGGSKHQEDPTWAPMAGGLPGAKGVHCCLGNIPRQLGGQGSWLVTPPPPLSGPQVQSLPLGEPDVRGRSKTQG